MRKLKHHEQKLLKKVDFFQYKNEHNVQEIKVLRRYHIQHREDYLKYNKLCGAVQQIVNRLKQLDPADPFRIHATTSLCEKLYDLGLISKQSLLNCEKITASAFCRRRLPVIMFRMRMAETLKEAVTFVEQGHVRVGPETVTDPAFLVTRSFEDFVTWVESSKIQKTILKYNDKLDDYDLLN